MDWASLTFDALGLRATVDGPFRARLVDTVSTAGIEVAVGVGVIVREERLLGDDVIRGHLLVRERELAWRDGRLVAVLLDG